MSLSHYARFLKCLSFCALAASFSQLCAQTPVSVKVATLNPGNAISEDFSGLSFETALMLPSPSGIRYFRPDNLPIVNLFRTLGIKSLRIGGNTGDRDATQAPSEEDIDSLFAFSKAAGVKVIYCLRLYNGDPQKTAQTAKYIMDRYAPLLECFSIGQEPSAYPLEKVDTRPVTERMGGAAEKFPYSDFSQRWRLFADEILKTVPNARFSGPGVHKNPEWIRRFISDFIPSKPVSMVTMHLYPGGPGGKVPTPESGRAQMLSGEFDALYKGLHDAFVPIVLSKSLPYRLEEVNNFFNGGAANVSNTYAAALWGVDFMWWWASHGAAGVNFHTGDRVSAGSLLQLCKYTAFYSVPEGCSVQPLGYGLLTFGLAGKGRFVPVSVSSQSPVLLSAYAVLGPEKTLSVTLVNKQNGPEVKPLDITLAAEKMGVSGECISLVSPNGDITATTGITVGKASIETNGTWRAQWTPIVPSASGQYQFKLPAASVMVLKLKLKEGIQIKQPTASAY